MKEYTVYFRHKSSPYPETHTVKCHSIHAAIRNTIEDLEAVYYMNAEDVDICHVEEEK